MATTKTLTPTNQTISIPELSDSPDMSVPADAIDKEADAINTLNSNMSYLSRGDGTLYRLDAIDLNTVKRTGNYYANNNCTHCISGGGYLQVHEYSTTYVKQLMQGYNSSAYFTRQCDNGTWSEWEQLALNSNLASLQMVKISKMVTIPDGTQTTQTVDVDISDFIPSGKSIHSISNARLTNYMLPYISGTQMTWIEGINPSTNIIKIKNTSTMWNNYSLTMVAFVQ